MLSLSWRRFARRYLPLLDAGADFPPFFPEFVHCLPINVPPLFGSLSEMACMAFVMLGFPKRDSKQRPISFSASNIPREIVTDTCPEYVYFFAPLTK